MKNFKIKLILLVSLVFFTACSSVQTTPKYEKKERVTWRKMEGSVIVLPLEAGDIIIKEKTANPIGMFGHVAIMKNDRTVVDYPKFGNKSYTIDISYWLEKGRDILVLRYKNMSDEFKKRLVRNMEKYFGKHWDKNKYVKRGVQKVNINSSLSYVVPVFLKFLKYGGFSVWPVIKKVKGS